MYNKMLLVIRKTVEHFGWVLCRIEDGTTHIIWAIGNIY